MALNWICPFCGHAQTVVGKRSAAIKTKFDLEDDIAEKEIAIVAHATSCANQDCKKTQVIIDVGRPIWVKMQYGDRVSQVLPEGRLFSQTVVPMGAAKPQPEYIPAPLREDYQEACLIRDLSPKASATLVRRCLQGMIRDFARIKKPTLDQEIKALRLAVENSSADRAITMESVDAIDHVRSIGNIGAHMEKDIDLIIPVDPNEAQILIELVEALFQEWYVARYKREQTFGKISAISAEKKSIKDGSALQKLIEDQSGQ